jgi:uncharacterized protein YdaU (DUF1376 family)
MNKAPAFQFYAQDFLTGVMYLTNEEIGIYIKMLAKQWTDGKIPKKRLGFLVGYEWDNLSEELRSKFTDNGEYILNERLEKEREKREKFHEIQSKNGKKGGRPKKNNNETNEIADKKSQIKPNPFKNQKPNQSQKKPLEDGRLKTEGENEEEIEDENEIKFPFTSKKFLQQWEIWKDYKKKEFRFDYKTSQSEQAALSELRNKSSGDEETAIGIIHQSMANGWKGFFELKTNNHGTTKNGKQNSRTAAFAAADPRWRER